MQEVFHSEVPELFRDRSAPQGRDINTVLIYCSLREALLCNFLRQNLLAKRVDRQLIKRLLADNKSTSQRMDRLFPSVFGEKWDATMQRLTQKNSSQANPVDYENVSLFIKEVAAQRNMFVHEGSSWGVTRDLSRRCINSSWKMTTLMALFHGDRQAADG